jgi:hypothetical protein
MYNVLKKVSSASVKKIIKKIIKKISSASVVHVHSLPRPNPLGRGGHNKKKNKKNNKKGIYYKFKFKSFNKSF